MAVVRKRPGEKLTVTITVKNTGTARATWGVDWALEDGYLIRIPTSERRIVTLGPGESKTLTWTGYLPEGLPVGKTARLVVYWSNPNEQGALHYPNYKATDNWVGIIGGAAAKLEVTHATVR